MPEFINYNGTLFPVDQPLLKLSNRSFRYGDGLFETIRLAGGHVQLLDAHVARMKQAASLVKFQLPEEFSEDWLRRQILELVVANGSVSDARIRLSIFRNDGGWYMPETNSVSYTIELTKLEEQNYQLNAKGLLIDVYTAFKKSTNALSSLKSANGLLYVLAGIHRKELKLDECLILNEQGQIIEAISSNLFAVKNGVLYTPPVSDGCINGVMRNKIIEIAQENRIAVYEIAVMQSVLLAADELFLTNAVHGIRWVVAYKQKRYFNSTAKKLVEKLNEQLIQIK